MATNTTNLRVMLDANVLIAGIVWPRWPYEVLRHALLGDFQLTLSQYVINQARRRIENRFPTHVQRLEEFLRDSGFEPVGEPTVEQLVQYKRLVRDETDVPIVLAALNASVDYLISEDKDLTTRDATTAELHKHLTILLSGTFLREVMGWTSEELENVRGRTWRDLA
ncbi:MAG: PIN domain-containing protein [Chloroflexota bacterium]